MGSVGMLRAAFEHPRLDEQAVVEKDLIGLVGDIHLFADRIVAVGDEDGDIGVAVGAVVTAGAGAEQHHSAQTSTVAPGQQRTEASQGRAGLRVDGG